MDDTYRYLLNQRAERGGGFLLLLDPDRVPVDHCCRLAEAARDCGVDALLVGTSVMINVNFTDAVKAIKERTSLPVILFPSSYGQINPYVDAMLFTSLLSSRNPTYLIDEQVKGAPLVKRCGIEPIPTAYLLIESGPLTSVQYISSSLPIPRSKPDIACAHALAAQYMGMKLVYLEAGSGAQQSVPLEMITAVSHYTDIPTLVGGGLQSPDDCAAAIQAGADFVVVGTQFEESSDLSYLTETASACHAKHSLTL